MNNHKIIRYFSISQRQHTVKKDLTLSQAQEHIRNPESSSHSCTGRTGLMRTKKLGAWYDMNVIIA